MKHPRTGTIRILALVVSVLGALTACREEAERPAPAAPPAVTPVEVTADAEQAEDEPGELATLRARVAELEAQLAACQGPQAPSGTETATIPEGVDVPAEGERATQTARADRPDAGARARRRRDDPSLLETILGPNDRRRGDDETIEIPNPASVLLGE